MRTSFLAFALLFPLTAGCGNVCDQMCTAQAEMIDGCLTTWETTWPELSYSGTDDFIERCMVVYGEALDGLDSGSTEAVVLEDRCSQDLQTATTDIDCQSLVSIDP
jgi:hypothetical protein